MKKTKERIQPSYSKKAKEPRWWIIYVLAPIVVGLLLFIIQKSAEEKYGDLVIACNVDSAKVFLNQEFKGFTQSNRPIRFESLKPGIYVLSVKKDGFNSLDTNLTITVGEITSIRTELKITGVIADNLPAANETLHTASPKFAHENGRNFVIMITVPSRFQNARIFIDGDWVANAPNTIWVSKGYHRLRVEKDEYYYEEMIQIPSRDLINIDADEFKVQK